MKTNKLTIILLFIIAILLGYIIYDKFLPNDILQDNLKNNDKEEESIKLVDKISLDYVTIYLTSDGIAYITPLNKEQINNINGGKNLKERLTTLYDRSFYYNIHIDNYQLKGYRVSLNSKITKINKIETKYNTYIIFLKENNTIGLFNYDEYYNLLETNVKDNYNDLKNILDIKDNYLIYLDGSKEELILE